jgi:hypothetical protein
MRIKKVKCRREVENDAGRPEAAQQVSSEDEFTRRAWMATVGQAAVGLGLIQTIRANAETTPHLPPGLYLPSTDHLSHALMNSERFHPIPANCPVDYVVPRTGPYKPQFFSPSEFAIIRRLTEVMLGEDSGDVVGEVAEWIDLRVFSSAGVRDAALQLDPAHRALAVAYYGAAAVHESETDDAQKVCRDGLHALNERAKSRYNSDFLHLTTEQQIELLEAIANTAVEEQLQDAGFQLFKLIRSEVIRGFYTSKVGLKELDYKGNGFYAASPGCTTR